MVPPAARALLGHKDVWGPGPGRLRAQLVPAPLPGTAPEVPRGGAARTSLGRGASWVPKGPSERPSRDQTMLDALYDREP